MINKINREYPVISIKYQIILECIQLFSLKKHFPKVSIFGNSGHDRQMS